MVAAAWRIVALLVLAGCVAPAVAAKTVQVEGVVEALGPGAFVGANHFVADAAALLQEGTSGPAAAFHLAFPGGTVRIVNLPTEEIWTPDGAKVILPGPGPEELWAVVEAEGLGFIPDPGDSVGSHSRILATTVPFALDLSGHHRVGITLASPLQPPPVRGPFADASQVAGHAVAPAGPLGYATVDGPGVAWDQPFVALLTGGAVQVGSRTWDTGRALNLTRSAFDPITGLGRHVFDNVVAVAEGRSGHLQWEAAGGWSLGLERLAGDLQGDAAWTGVDATVQAGGRALPADIELFHLKGDLVLEASFREAAHWTVAGEATFVGVDGRLSATGAAAVAGGFGLAALAWLLWSRGALAFLLGRTGARLTKADPLASPGRRRVLAAIHGLQPASRSTLQEATGLSRTAVAYHLRILLAYEILQVAPGPLGTDAAAAGRPQRNATYVLNSGSMSFHLAGDQLPEGVASDDAEGVLVSKALAAAQGHPVRRNLYGLLRELGRADFPALAAAWRDRGLGTLAQSSATHHLQLLVRTGALAVVRQGHRKVYTPTIDPDAARVQQYRRFLGQVRGLDLVRALARQGPLAEADLMALVADRKPREARRRIGRLADLGILRFDPAHSRYDVEDFLKPCVARL